MTATRSKAVDALILELNKVIARVAADAKIPFRWSSLQCNQSTVSEWHTDAYNEGDSMLLAFGSYEGGEFQIADKAPTQVRHAAAFSQGNTAHRSLPFSGHRFSVLASQHHVFQALGPEEQARLREAGFQTEGVALRVEAPELVRAGHWGNVLVRLDSQQLPRPARPQRTENRAEQRAREEAAAIGGLRRPAAAIRRLPRLRALGAELWKALDE